MRRYGRAVRRGLSGLLILAVLLMSVAQVAAAPLPPVQHQHSGVHHMAGMTHDHSMPPAKHDSGTHHGFDCCVAGGCLMWPAALSGPALSVPLNLSASIYPITVAARPPGLGAAPDLPPPRRIV